MSEQQQHPLIALMNKSELTVDMMKARANTKLPEPAKVDQSNKVVVVTGANVGIGYEAAKFIAGLNPKKLILACRNLTKANEALNKIKSETGYANIEAWELDLASFDSVKAFAKRFNDSGLPLDTFVSNAGVASAEWVETSDGYEATYQTNHICNMLLVLLLTPSLKKSASPRVEVVASEVHFWAMLVQQEDPTPVTTLLNFKSSPPGQTYFCSKLLNILFAQEYARRCKDIWICSSTPGYTESELGSKHPTTGTAKPEGRQSHTMYPKRSTYDGAKTIIQCAVDPAPGASGAFFSDMKESTPRSMTLGEKGEALGRNTWKDTMNILSKYISHSEVPEWAWN